jgi:threonine/homoserine/homoserine lactone efflux protein
MELLLSIALIHLLACLSPGPDIFLVVLNSLRHNWRVGIWTTLGILSGVSLQIALGITGLTLLLTRGESAGQIVALAGGAWLVYLGIRGITGIRKRAPDPEAPKPEPVASPAFADAWLQGLLVNLLNPKALLFFLSIFSVMLGPDVPLQLRIACGITMVCVQGIAFSLVALLVDRPQFKTRWARLQVWLELGISCLLTALGIWIWISTWLNWMD